MGCWGWSVISVCDSGDVGTDAPGVMKPSDQARKNSLFLREGNPAQEEEVRALREKAGYRDRHG